MSTMTTSDVNPRQEAVSPELIRTARQTGLWYLGLAITGLVGFLLIRNQLYVADDAQATLANLVEQESLARLGVVAELGVVLTQAMVAVWFYRLFRSVSSVAAGALAAFGFVNAVAILVSAATLATALEVSGDASLAVAGSAATTAQLMYVVSGHLWAVGGLFFGLWLMPMGWLVLRSGWLPRPLGWTLIAGGVGYVLGTLVTYLLPGADVLATLLPLPATVGEFWIMGYLIFRGVRRPIS